MRPPHQGRGRPGTRPAGQDGQPAARLLKGRLRDEGSGARTRPEGSDGPGFPREAQAAGVSSAARRPRCPASHFPLHCALVPGTAAAAQPGASRCSTCTAPSPACVPVWPGAPGGRGDARLGRLFCRHAETGGGWEGVCDWPTRALQTGGLGLEHTAQCWVLRVTRDTGEPAAPSQGRHPDTARVSPAVSGGGDCPPERGHPNLRM